MIQDPPALPTQPPPLPADLGKPIVPVSEADRIALLDVLRGFALLGILIANIPHFLQPLSDYTLRPELVFSPLDRIADFLSLFLVDDKFRSLFSVLFGIGFAIQMDRATSRALDPKSLYRRRLTVLMGFGLVHGILIWDGDILFAYGIAGFALLPFQYCKNLTIFVWALVLNFVPILIFVLVSLGLIVWAEHLPDFMSDEVHETIGPYVNGSYLDVVLYRIKDFPMILFATVIYLPGVVGMFLFGMLIGRSRILSDAPGNWQILRKSSIFCATIGLVGCLISASTTTVGLIKGEIGISCLGMTLSLISAPVLCGAYISGAALLMHIKPQLRILRCLAAAGRMALTNYLLQSVICTSLFYGYGFGLAGEMGRFGTMAIALLIFAAQAYLSFIWLKRFRYGPMEWLWRSLTYRSRQPM